MLNAENSICIPYLGLFLAILMQFTLKMCVAGRKRKKIRKNPYFGVEGHSRSSMLINLKSPSPVLVMICSMFVPICNCFHTKRVSGGKITFLGGTPLWRFSFEVNFFTKSYEVLSQKN